MHQPEVLYGVNPRPGPKPVLLTLKQRRALPIAEFYSTRRHVQVIVAEQSYWVALWLEWSPTVANYVERPADPSADCKWLADFWIETDDRDLLVDIVLDGSRQGAPAVADPWALASDGFEYREEGAHRLSWQWLWSRRALLLNLEQAHPFAVAAEVRGGLKNLCRRVVDSASSEPIALRKLLSRVGADSYSGQCAVFRLVQQGALNLDWSEPLTLETRVSRGGYAP